MGAGGRGNGSCQVVKAKLFAICCAFGHKVWAALPLILQRAEFLQGAKVLELGAGCGLLVSQMQPFALAHSISDAEIHDMCAYKTHLINTHLSLSKTMARCLVHD